MCLTDVTAYLDLQCCSYFARRFGEEPKQRAKRRSFVINLDSEAVKRSLHPSPLVTITLSGARDLFGRATDAH